MGAARLRASKVGLLAAKCHVRQDLLPMIWALAGLPIKAKSPRPGTKKLLTGLLQAVGQKFVQL